MSGKRTLAVFFGGRSAEHDVSVVTGLQAISALDPDRFDAVPVYVAPDGAWYTGPALLNRQTYIPNEAALAALTRVELPIADCRGRGILRSPAKGLFGKARDILFDAALLAFHGERGEDGRIQGLFELAGVPYTGMRFLASALFMDKILTKEVLAARGIPVLPSWRIDRPASGGLVPDPADLAKTVKDAPYPLIVKPCHLGSSIGVARVETFDELRAVLPPILRLDDVALAEPCVPHLEEYNISVAAFADGIRTSAIERPKRTQDLLDFRQKYMSGGGKSGKSGTKTPGQSSQGMLSLTRDISPELDPVFEARIRAYATVAYRAVTAAGAPRIDFLCNSETGELWLNEINPCPGSFAYFLWEAATPPVLFGDLLAHLADEAVAQADSHPAPDDPVPADARLFRR